jgi:SAM-dependent methyltransferase
VQQKKNVKYWVDCWNATHPFSGLMDEDQLAVFWNKRSGDFAKKISSAQSRKRCRENLGFLEKAGVRIKGAKILDIGCGPGTLSIPLARAGADVTSLDISSGMLERLKETADNEGLSIRPVECSWWNADIDKLGFRGGFDLVISSMTPAIKDSETFDRMIACSRKYCFYLGSLPSTGDVAIQALLRGMRKTPGPLRSQMGILYPFMYLYLKGYTPEININRRKWKEDLDWDKAAEHAIDIISHEQACTEAMKKKIKNYYKKTAVDGKCSFQNEMFLGMMIWRVDQ